MTEFARVQASSVANPVLLVDGIGRARIHDIGPRAVLPVSVEYGDRVTQDANGFRTIGTRFERTDERVEGMPVYRMAGVQGKPEIRRGYL